MGAFHSMHVSAFQETQRVSFQAFAKQKHFKRVAHFKRSRSFAIPFALLPKMQEFYVLYTYFHFKRARKLATSHKRKIKVMTNNIIVDLSMDFSIAIVTLCDAIKGKSAITNQLLRSATSIGANIHEANYASSRADFIAKMQIALKECYETEYWLELFVKTAIISEAQYKNLKNNCGKIRKLLISSINTAKANV